MRHADSAAGPVGALAIAMIEATLGALLMAAPGGANGARASGPPAGEATVGLPPIAGGTEDEGLPAPPTGPAPEARHGPAGPAGSSGSGPVRRNAHHHGPATHGLARGDAPAGPGLTKPSSRALRGGAAYRKRAWPATRQAVARWVPAHVGAQRLP